MALKNHFEISNEGVHFRIKNRRKKRLPKTKIEVICKAEVRKRDRKSN